MFLDLCSQQILEVFKKEKKKKRDVGLGKIDIKETDTGILVSASYWFVITIALPPLNRTMEFQLQRFKELLLCLQLLGV